MRRHHVLSAEQFIAQGTSPGAILSIASTQKDRTLRSQLEDTARIVAIETGLPLQIPGAASDARQRGSNDNKRSRRAA
ncbi:hypothetical protein G6M14_08935 [Agrobacterium tumefaciens]|uniref:hypothetical protein n=1 Tax=Agrobacterium tumefaciens TaxID=358 RepID=UPI001571E421|nr:hypothetical protein [Agrobacterium tumefaciens]